MSLHDLLKCRDCDKGKRDCNCPKFLEPWDYAIANFKDFDVKYRKWTLNWCFIGEGLSGDFDPDDDEDTPLLRADLSYDGDVPELQDASYCTLATVLTPKDKLIEGAMELLQSLPDSPKNYKRVMEQWTWREYD